MRLLAPALLITGTALIVACSGGSTPAATPTSSTGAASPSRAAGGAATSSPIAPGGTASVTGIVGTLSTDPQVIEITRLSGATVNRVQVGGSTVIRNSTGARIGFDGIRTSDRIIAEGRISDRGDALVAADVTVSAVTSGAAPGG